ncbi:hypothetical protein SEA_NICHOLAS_62 [Mycobacterium phage Nicholas]|uniref:Uncharacterized protein n=1 Tax=Mycobacterium phage Lumos TaxID=1701852 RepID=A0A0K2CMC6_9CAUD|nr:Erf-like ssDNA annealing protein [Mycobacterium phage Snenia]YP_010012521.1 Erf-like ssDNA annealing protein [Mycobacterium phage Lumos]ASM62799.1 hypothetical protein SEA_CLAUTASTROPHE_62 [Mycobacterium phage Clautastrophe]ASR86990.1 hypothetical protein SEA_KINGSOLOMON_62 [Mycobacterium phage Kingsolomon]ASR87333.1 hypothetical protein SEA_NICHOLAS_62 [Mycobacterium phage Nicholas]QDF16646.1 hypothetical protein PBI_MSGREEN_63 [Mycobacterium phage MsGreen]QPL14945.1 hypothetical protein 
MLNNTIAGVPVGLIEAPAHLFVPCEQCFEREAEFAVGHSDHKLVCESCLDWGDSRRWWHLEPRQALRGSGAIALAHDAEHDAYTYWVWAA